MKAKELRELNLEELKRREAELRSQLLDLRIKKITQQLKNPLELRSVKRDIARVLTIMKEKV